jgi:class 3 adenylate cyclase
VLNDRINGITAGRVMPDLEQVTIGRGKRFTLPVLFLDICGFSARPNWTEEEQKLVLSTMNIFMAEMLNIVRDFGGTYEKNTGDGLMAYFGDGCLTDADRVKPAVEAAVVMHYVNDQLFTPWFRRQGIEPIAFRVGIDLGPVTIARVGLREIRRDPERSGTVTMIPKF